MELTAAEWLEVIRREYLESFIPAGGAAVKFAVPYPPIGHEELSHELSTGSAIDPKTGKSLDDIKPHIDSFEWLSDADRKKIYEDNARRLYKLDV